MMKRYLESHIIADLERKMVFLGGPRQVGKTHLALQILKGDETHPGYLNWDYIGDKRIIINAEIPEKEKLIVFDEIHKYQHWRNTIKGIYDKNKSSKRFLITGSAKLDYYRRGGDSLQGRYFYYRLHPLSLFELGKKNTRANLDLLLTFGGFPEPFLSQNRKDWNRWQHNRLSRVVHEDLNNLEDVRSIDKIDHLILLLNERAGSVLSINSMREDLGVAFETTASWISKLENLYYCYRIKPFGLNTLKAIKKEQKLYLWDWSLCSTAGSRFENLVASNLLKFCHFMQDVEGRVIELQFIRDREGREVDFVLVENGQPLFAVECKTGNQELSRHIKYFSARTNIPIFYQLHLREKNTIIHSHRSHIMPFSDFCFDVLKI